ncbi:OsmC family protein [Gluconacetobacter diazotrophicus PA1 5]|uniref:OsmC family peroxiredoxin n=1 Tax=Gluconacetobacter diazotrophicus TaxID=33996 RepID=UPI000173B386|nr:OsmC family peroxiredoxin [Gluconacetobacter diazotrophicus]ACI52863.1 OsmC family protein [Gluconacetobacter diazotrophicus PA1 5]TWB08992.1 osmotically inducible protein OsmC [Gluconacetobacter diazotrophicus]
MTIKKYGTAQWQGGLKDGKGTVSTESGALSAHPYGFNTRFGDVKGTNPEELVGAAHAACFAMALSNILGEAGLTASALDAKSVVSLDKQPNGFAVTAAHLTLTATIPGTTDAQFQELAAKAKAGCPISKLLKAEITLEATLKS